MAVHDRQAVPQRSSERKILQRWLMRPMPPRTKSNYAIVGAVPSQAPGKIERGVPQREGCDRRALPPRGDDDLKGEDQMKPNARDTVRAAIEEITAKHPRAGDARLVEIFAERMLNDGDVRMAAAIFLVKAVGTQKGQRNRRATALEKTRREAEIRARVDVAVEAVKLRVLDLVMPNSLTMRQCTGQQMVEFGGAYQRIGERIGPDRIVGQVLSEREAAAILREDGRGEGRSKGRLEPSQLRH